VGRRIHTLATALCILGVALPALGQRLPKVREIDGDPVVTVLHPDAIPALNRPKFKPASQAKFMRDDEAVVGVVHNGVAKAYSLWHLDQHEIVNDQLGSDPVAVTW
jgi:hypothetical protein